MGAYYVIRNGEIKMRLPEATVDRDGAVSSYGGYVIDGELAKADGKLEEVARLAKGPSVEQSRPPLPRQGRHLAERPGDDLRSRP